MSLCLLHTGFFLLHALLLTSPRVQCESLPSGKPFLWPSYMRGKEGKKCEANTAVKHISGQVPAASLRAQMTLQGTT